MFRGLIFKLAHSLASKTTREGAWSIHAKP